MAADTSKRKGVRGRTPEMLAVDRIRTALVYFRFQLFDGMTVERTLRRIERVMKAHDLERTLKLRAAAAAPPVSRADQLGAAHAALGRAELICIGVMYALKESPHDDAWRRAAASAAAIGGQRKLLAAQLPPSSSPRGGGANA